MKTKSSNYITSNLTKGFIKMSQLLLVALIGVYGSYCSSNPNSKVSSNPNSEISSDDGYFLVDSWEKLVCVGRAGATVNGLDCSDKTNWTLSASYRLTSDINTTSNVAGIGGRRDGNDGDCVAYDGDSGGANAGDLEHDETCAGWTPIGSDTNNFTGTFDGNGFRITNLYINRPTTDYVGLFGKISGASAVIRNLGVEVQIVVGQAQVGGLVGHMDSGSSIRNSYATGAVTGSGNFAGGLVGYMDSGSSIRNGYATGAVTGSGNFAGGLVGHMDSGSSIRNSYATGAVTGTGKFCRRLGRVS